MVDVERFHERHHELIADRVGVYRDRVGATRRKRIRDQRRHQAYIDAYNTLVGHLRACHGYRRYVGLPLSIDEYEAIHTAYHASESA